MTNQERDDLPLTIHWEVRWRVVSIYEAATRSLVKRLHKEPSENDVFVFVNEVRQKPNAWYLLLKRAEAIREREMKAEMGLLQNPLKNPTIHDVRRARSAIEFRYRQINMDTKKNRAFLDPVLFSEE